MLIKSIDRKIPLACPRFHACTSQRVVRTHRHGELELCNNTKKKKTCCSYAWVYRKIQKQKGEMRRQTHTERKCIFRAQFLTSSPGFAPIIPLVFKRDLSSSILS